MGQNMNDIKRRIKSVTSTKQITKAMELVATAKLKRARNKLDASKPYFNTIVNSITEIMTHTKGIRHPFIDKREIENSLYIVITGDRGLAGGYNSNICKLVEQKVTDKSKAKLVTIGSKGRDFFNARGYEIISSYTGVSETPSLEVAVEICTEAVEMYKNKEIDAIYVVYTEFVSTIAYEPHALKILPVELENNKEEAEEEFPVLFRYEPSPESVLEYLVPKYMNSVVFGACVESSASESGSRRIAMENATDNAEDMIDELQLVYNRARQAAITQEISEIVAGADALN
ncbi:ATP synthase F1 subcomplex gamma subunit [Dethiosulfatibacter aminovorans DSM 17477]|uniref:ATP synthase gamma chain n=1 Tax=Dethiosulfatibacter aminovorans DSM 17477 TaxID=1121476 RepID=A0A1M6LTW3_9FIRM|nr:ATP synthase F1 subunit gamma [Dethiosulfatibacter aminovorans]SHJ74542.1 ATP synthase F1 subcomplex gamma subunit [Dethiosulfatibacter aminovorans DSM 17477]